jgi:hypothetical protein
MEPDWWVRAIFVAVFMAPLAWVAFQLCKALILVAVG